jgi:hypothetical protein
MTLTEELGFKRRDDPAAYEREWRKRNSEKNNAYHRDYYHNTTKNKPEAVIARNRSASFSRRKAKYGLSRTEYTDLLTKQGGRCIIYNVEYGENLRVDHDHKTGVIRGLLCANCNTGLGMFQDKPSLLKSAARYLERHNTEVEL